MPIIDLTEQPEAGPPVTPTRVRWTMRDHVAMVREAQGPRPDYYDSYRFTGRTYRTRDVLVVPND